MSRQVPANGWSERTDRETCRTKDRIKLSLNEVPISSCSDVVETISSEPTRFAIAIVVSPFTLRASGAPVGQTVNPSQAIESRPEMGQMFPYCPSLSPDYET